MILAVVAGTKAIVGQETKINMVIDPTQKPPGSVSSII